MTGLGPTSWRKLDVRKQRLRGGPAVEVSFFGAGDELATKDAMRRGRETRKRSEGVGVERGKDRKGRNELRS
jgi:hypothetical protein